MVITKIWKTILSLFLLLFAIAESYLIVELLQPLQVVEKRLVVETREKQTEIKEERERSIEQNVPADGQASNSAANEVLNPSDKLDEAEKQVLNTDRVLERPPEAEQIIQQAEAGDESERLSGEEGETGKVQKAENDGAKENSLAQSVKAEQSPQKVEVADEAESPPRKENEAEQAQGGEGEAAAENLPAQKVKAEQPVKKTEAMVAGGAPEKAAAPQPELFPRPDSLKPAIRFWTMVFTESASNGGYIHDDRDMGKVYERLYFDFAWDGGQRQIKNAIYKYRNILKSLAKGKRKDLSCDEQRVLAMWGKNTSARTFKKAAERLHFQRGMSNRFLAGLVRSGSWKPHIRKVLQKHKLPQEIAALPHVESGYRPTVWSLVGAAGLWQFMPATGRRFMRVDHVIDERMDPFKASESAAKLLKYNYSIIGSWPLALTAYNHGLGGMLRAVKRSKTKDIGKIVKRYRGRAFGFASRNFYVSFLAALDVSENAEKYFGEFKVNPPKEPTVYRLGAYVPAEELAESLDMEIGDLKQLNPALRDAVWNGSKYIPKEYPLNLPDDWDREETMDELLWAAYENGFSKQKQDLFHKVVRGDSLSTIAQKYGVSTKSLKAINDIGKKNRIRVGKRLKLPLSRAPSKPASTIAKAAKAQGKKKRPDAVVKVTTGKKPRTASLSADPFDYSVRNGRIKIQPGETLGHIAIWSGVSANRLLRLNRLKSAKSIVFGRKIRLDFSKVKKRSFEKARIAYHKKRQTQYFRQHRIAKTQTHKTKAGDSLWRLAIRKYRIPLWLLCQYNPDLEVGRMLPAGTRVRIPVVKRLSRRVKT